jgi:hypothetical protein
MPFKWLNKASVLLHRHSLESVYRRPARDITYTACLNTMTTTRTRKYLA